MKEKKSLSLIELVAIAIGGMVGGGIFSILGIAVSLLGNAAPLAIALGGVLAFLAAYSYVKLAALYKDEGATYSFFRKTFPKSGFAISVVGWLVSFGYISTLGIYAYTFASYLASTFPGHGNEWIRKGIAGGVILFFTAVNVISVRGMGRVEDFLVYTKIIVLLIVSFLFLAKGDVQCFEHVFDSGFPLARMLVVASVTFVAYEGFQLVIHAVREMENPGRNVARAIYISIAIVVLLYFLLSIATISLIPKAELVRNQEFALAAGAGRYVGKAGSLLVIFGALMATSSAISGTLFGASRLMAVIATDRYLPKVLTRRRKNQVPANAVIAMAVLSFLLVLSGGLKLLLEFGSTTFIFVSFLMACANYKKRAETRTNVLTAAVAMITLFAAGVTILVYEFKTNSWQLVYIMGVYTAVVLLAWIYSLKKKVPAAAEA